MNFILKKATIGALLLLTSQYVIADSSDCVNPIGYLQKTICENPDLSAEDDQITTLYNRAAISNPQVIHDQSAWVGKILKCDTVECLRDLYTRRLDVLQENAPNVPVATTAGTEANATTPSSMAVSLDAAATSSAATAASDAAESESLAASSGRAASVGNVNNSASQPATASSTASDISSSPTVTSLPASDGSSQPAAASDTTPESNDGLGFWGWVKLIGFVAASILFWGYSHSCPKCKKLWGDKTVGSELIDESHGHETVTRQDQHRGRDGKIYKTVERQEQVAVTYRTYVVHHRCPRCNHRWITQKEEKS